MDDFFHGWRHRSLVVTDSLHLPSRMLLTTLLPKQVYSADQSLIIVIRADPNDDPPSLPWVRTDRFIKNPEWITLEDIVWQFQCCGFAVGVEKPNGPIFLIPYWSIEIPLMLISAYLLLVKVERYKRDEIKSS